MSRAFRFAGLILLLGTLAVGPYFRGLFFWTQLLTGIAVVGVGFTLWLIGRRLGNLPLHLPGRPAGWALLALLLCYLLQFAWPAFARGNIDWSLRVAAAWFVFVALQAESGPQLRRLLGWLCTLSAAGVALLGFLEYTGYALQDPNLASMLSLVALNNRMFTILQYPNTAAVFFLAAMLTAAGLALDDLKAWKLGAAGGLMALLSLAFFFTVSRGAVVALPFGLLLFFLGLERSRRWPALLLLLISFSALAVAMRPVGAASAARNWAAAFGWIGVAVLLGIIGGLLVAAFLRLKARVQLIAAGSVLVMAVAALLLLRPAGGLLPKQAQRLFDINLRTQNVVLRLIFDQDAARMVLDQPLGRGGAGWDRSYRQYQSFNYIARDTHNQYAQTAVEAGVPGLLALLTALGTALWAAWRHRRANALGWSLAAAAGLIAGHSAIDFNLSFGAVWLLLWALLAAAAPPPSTADERRTPLRLGAGLTAGVAVAALAIVLSVASRYTDQADALAKEGRTDEAIALARRAVRLDPWDTEALLLIGDRPALERAAKLDPNHAGIRWELTLLLERSRELEPALEQARMAVRNQPMLAVLSAKQATLAGALMNGALHDGDIARASQLGDELVDLGTAFEERKAVADTYRHLWGSTAPLEMAADFQLRYGQGLALAGRVDEAIPHLQAAAKVGLLDSEAEVWLYAIAEKRGDEATMRALAGKPWIRFRNSNPVYRFLRDM